MIYKTCLVHHEEMIPFPTEEERENIERRDGKPAVKIRDKKEQQVGSIRYAAHWPCIALLGVNKRINYEAVVILFASNVWRILTKDNDRLKVCISGLVHRYLDFLRHVTLKFSRFDVPRQVLLQKSRSAIQIGKSQNLSDTQIKDNSHRKQKMELYGRWTNKVRLLQYMQVESIKMDVAGVFCPGGCCRMFSLKLLMSSIGERGWSTPGGRAGRCRYSMIGLFHQRPMSLGWRLRLDY